jgi:hypothetical protein
LFKKPGALAGLVVGQIYRGMLAAVRAGRGAQELHAGWSAEKSADQTAPIALIGFDRR